MSIIFRGSIKINEPFTNKNIRALGEFRYWKICQDNQTIVHDPQEIYNYCEKNNLPQPTLSDYHFTMRVVASYIFRDGKTLEGFMEINIEDDNRILRNIGTMQVNNDVVDFKVKDMLLVIVELANELEMLKKENVELRKLNGQLMDEIDYSPEGRGALEAKEHFESLCNSPKQRPTNALPEAGVALVKKLKLKNINKNSLP